MVGFLGEQKWRMGKGENIRLPILANVDQSIKENEEIDHSELEKESPEQFSSDSKQEIRSFPQLLTGKYSEANLSRLLFHLRMRNDKAQNIWPQAKKAALWGVIDALVYKSYLIETSRMEYMSSLSNYLGLKESRVKDGYSAIQSEIKEKAISFINQPVKRKK